MKFPARTSLFLLVSLISSVAAYAAEPLPPWGGWVTHDIGEVFSFSAPPDLIDATPAGPSDSLVGIYESPSLGLTFDYGKYSAQPTAEAGTENYHGREIQVGPLTCVIATFYRKDGYHYPDLKPYFAQLYCADLADGDDKLSVLVRAETAAGQKTAIQIIRSLKWQENSPALASPLPPATLTCEVNLTRNSVELPDPLNLSIESTEVGPFSGSAQGGDFTFFIAANATDVSFSIRQTSTGRSQNVRLPLVLNREFGSTFDFDDHLKANVRCRVARSK